MAIDRPLALRTAETFLRQGKLDAAIAEFVRVVEDQPRDWSTANTLGDLYLQAGQGDKAVAQFARIADGLSREGFWLRAAALYKKIIRIRPDDEHAWLQAGEMAAQQGVLVDARAFLNTVAERRLARGDRQGAAEIRIRMASLDPSERGGLDPVFSHALAAGDLDGAERSAVGPDDLQELGQAHADRGDITSAARFLTAESAAHDPELLLNVAAAKLLAGARDDGLDIFRRLLNREPGRSHEIALIGCEIARLAPDAGFAVVEIAAETAVIEGDWPAAAAMIQAFLARLPDHIPALTRLIEICVDGRLESTLATAETQLAEACFAAGLGAPPPGLEPMAAPVLEIVQDPAEVWIMADAAAAAGAPSLEPAAAAEMADDLLEVDLSDLLGDFISVSEQDGSREQYERGLTLRDEGRIDESIRAFQVAAADPRLRFAAAAAVARLHRQRGDIRLAVDWFEQAAEAPPPAADTAHPLLYELAEALESLGEFERALAVCLELQTDAGGYRDVAERIRRLTGIQTRG
ncbi:MAG: tetratricopeptide repeat protein [Acidobacteriota bacterium]